MSEFSIGIIADWLRLPFEESLKTCADMGADGVQLYAVSGEMAPENLTPAQIAEKKALLMKRDIALWDVLHSCEIEGASDQSIRNPVPNDIPGLLRAAPIAQVFTTGRRAHDLYQKLLQGESICLPSPSAANCALPLEILIERYRVILPFLDEDCDNIAT